MKKSSTDKLEVEGKMSEKGADRAGLIQAIAVLIGCSLFGTAALVAALNLV